MFSDNYQKVVIVQALGILFTGLPTLVETVVPGRSLPAEPLLRVALLPGSSPVPTRIGSANWPLEAPLPGRPSHGMAPAIRLNRLTRSTRKFPPNQNQPEE